MALASWAGFFARPAAGTTNTVVSGLTFAPTVVIFMTAHNTTQNWRAGLQSAIGWACKGVGSGTIAAKSMRQASNNGATPVALLAQGQSAFLISDQAGTTQARFTAITFNSDGFTINWDDSPYDGEQEHVGYLAFGGDAVGETASLSQVITQAVGETLTIPHNLSFNPSAAIIMAQAGEPAQAQSIGMVAGSGNNQWALGLADKQNASPSNQYRRLANARAVELVNANDGNVVIGANVSKLSRSGLDLTIAERGILPIQNVGTGVAGAGTSPLQFNNPAHISIHPATGDIYVADVTNGRLLRLSSSGAYLGSVALSGIWGVHVSAAPVVVSGVVTQYPVFAARRAPFYGLTVHHPTTFAQVGDSGFGFECIDVTCDANYVYALAYSLTQIYRWPLNPLFSAVGRILYGFAAGSADGRFNGPIGVHAQNGEVYVADAGNSRIQVFDTAINFKRKFSLSNTNIYGICGAANGSDIWVSRYTNDVIERYSSTGTLLQTVGNTNDAIGIDRAANGDLWVSDYGAHQLHRVGFSTQPTQLSILYLGGMAANCGVSAKSTTTTPHKQTITTGVKGRAAIFASHQEVNVNQTYDHLRYGMGLSSLDNWYPQQWPPHIGRNWIMAANTPLPNGTAINAQLWDAYFGYTMSQPTAANQPTYQAPSTPAGLGAINFDGTNDFLLAPSISMSNIDAYYEFVIKFDTLPGTTTILSDNPAGGGLLFYILSDGSIHIYKNGTGDITASAAGTVTTGQWYIIGFLIQASRARIFVNGVLKQDAGHAQTLTAGKSAYIGSNIGALQYLDGQIAQLTVTTGTAMDTDANRQRQEGFSSWSILGSGAFLPVGHPWKNAAPSAVNSRGIYGFTEQAADNVSSAIANSYYNNLALIKANNTTQTIEAQSYYWEDFSVGGELGINWWINDAVASQIAWGVFGNQGPQLGSIMSGLLTFNPLRFGTPVWLNCNINAALDFFPQAFGNKGNISSVSFAGALTFSPKLGKQHLLLATMSAAGVFAPKGFGFLRPLSATIAAQGTFTPIKAGNPGALLDARMAAAASFSPKYFRYVPYTSGLKSPFSTTIASKAEFLSRFAIKLPKVLPAGIDDLVGTINWHLNPSAERGLFGWFAEGAGPDITQEFDTAWDGAASVKKVTTTGSAGQGIAARGVAGLELTGLNPIDNNPYRVLGSLHIYSDNGTTAELWLRVRYTDGTIVDGPKSTIPLAAEWVNHIAPSVELDPAKKLNFAEIVVATATPVAISLRGDGAQLEEDRGQGNTFFAIGTYGKEVGSWVDLGGRANGLPHLSFSVRQPVPRIIRNVGRGGEILIEPTMWKATWDNRFVEDISDLVIDADVSADRERDVTWQLDATFRYDGFYNRLEENLDWIAPVMKITYPDGTVKQGQLGLYFLVPGATRRGEYERTVKVSAFDPLWLLGHQQFANSFIARTTHERMRVVREALDAAVFTGGDPLAGRRYSGPNSGKGWKKDHEWSQDTDVLDFANQVLEASAMTNLYTTGQGEMHWREVGLNRLSERTPVRAWIANVPRNVSVDPRIPRSVQLKSEVIGTIDTVPLAQDAFDEVLLIVDDPDNTRRIKVRGRVRGHGRHGRVVTGRGDRKRVRKLPAPLVDDEDTAQQIASYLADKLSNRTQTIKLAVLPDPSVNYIGETVLLGIWDAYGEPVAVGQFEVLNIHWGFTPSTCLQVMELAFVDQGDAEIVVSNESLTGLIA